MSSHDPHDFDPFFSGQHVMAIFRGHGAERTVELAQRAWRLGIRCVEVPLQSAADAASLQAVIDAAAGTNAVVGAGTIVSLELTERAAALGAAFTVSPGYDAEVVDASGELGMPSLPGVATASEVHAALAHGLRWMKAFPAIALGAPWFTAMRGPFPQARFVATGGVDPHNAYTFLHAGARLVAIGSGFERPEAISDIARLSSSDPTEPFS